jgi:hypothetical protein
MSDPLMGLPSSAKAGRRKEGMVWVELGGGEDWEVGWQSEELRKHGIPKSLADVPGPFFGKVGRQPSRLDLERNTWEGWKVEAKEYHRQVWNDLKTNSNRRTTQAAKETASGWNSGWQRYFQELLGRVEGSEGDTADIQSRHPNLVTLLKAMADGGSWPEDTELTPWDEYFTVGGYETEAKADGGSTYRVNRILEAGEFGDLAASRRNKGLQRMTLPELAYVVRDLYGIAVVKLLLSEAVARNYSESGLTILLLRAVQWGPQITYWMLRAKDPKALSEHVKQVGTGSELGDLCLIDWTNGMSGYKMWDAEEKEKFKARLDGFFREDLQPQFGGAILQQPDKFLSGTSNDLQLEEYVNSLTWGTPGSTYTDARLEINWQGERFKVKPLKNQMPAAVSLRATLDGIAQAARQTTKTVVPVFEKMEFGKIRPVFGYPFYEYLLESYILKRIDNLFSIPGFLYDDDPKKEMKLLTLADVGYWWLNFDVAAMDTQITLQYQDRVLERLVDLANLPQYRNYAVRVHHNTWIKLPDFLGGGEKKSENALASGRPLTTLVGSANSKSIEMCAKNARSIQGSVETDLFGARTRLFFKGDDLTMPFSVTAGGFLGSLAMLVEMLLGGVLASEKLGLSRYGEILRKRISTRHEGGRRTGTAVEGSVSMLPNRNGAVTTAKPWTASDPLGESKLSSAVAGIRLSAGRMPGRPAFVVGLLLAVLLARKASRTPGGYATLMSPKETGGLGFLAPEFGMPAVVLDANGKKAVAEKRVAIRVSWEGDDKSWLSQSLTKRVTELFGPDFARFGPELAKRKLASTLNDRQRTSGMRRFVQRSEERQSRFIRENVTRVGFLPNLPETVINEVAAIPNPTVGDGERLDARDFDVGKWKKYAGQLSLLDEVVSMSKKEDEGARVSALKILAGKEPQILGDVTSLTSVGMSRRQALDWLVEGRVGSGSLMGWHWWTSYYTSRILWTHRKELATTKRQWSLLAAEVQMNLARRFGRLGAMGNYRP